MYATVGYELNMKIHNAWMAWVDLAEGIPFWDPYGAVTAIGLILFGLFVGARKLIDIHW